MRNRIAFRSLGPCALWFAVMLAGAIGTWAQESAAEQKVAAIKQSLQSSMATLHLDDGT